jgi:hypothetical protein
MQYFCRNRASGIRFASISVDVAHILNASLIRFVNRSACSLLKLKKFRIRRLPFAFPA